MSTFFTYGDEMMTYVYNGPESAKDTRYNYHWEILKTSLDKTKTNYGSYQMLPSSNMNEKLQIKQLKRGSGNLTVIVRETSVEYEEILLPIRIPVDKDLVGYRVFLIRKEDQKRFSGITMLEHLKEVTIGQGQGWGDVDILRANGFFVDEGTNYEGLFKMLIKKRFDAFSRGVAEVIDEFEQRKVNLPSLHIEETIALYYPLPTYFWFSKNKQGEILAERVKEGLYTMLDDGSFNKIFNEYHKHVISRHDLGNRKIFRLNNPFLPKETPFDDERLWYKPILNKN